MLKEQEGFPVSSACKLLDLPRSTYYFQPVEEDALGLRHFAIELPDQAALDEVKNRVETAGIPTKQVEDGLLLFDPSQNGVLLTKKL